VKHWVPISVGLAVATLAFHTYRYSPNPIAAGAVTPKSIDLHDAFDDGAPGFLRLQKAQDREAFRNWFVLIAEYQLVQQERRRLPDEITDCSSLVRYAYREALRRHDAAWVHDRGLQSFTLPQSVAQYQFPNTPAGPKLFRTHAGVFSPADLTDGTYGEFADADALRRFNTHLVGRDLSLAQPGDLIFFRQLEQHSPFHSMIFIGASHLDASEHEPLLVYHTGPDGNHMGEVRRILVADLVRHPDARWRPLPGNPNFLGIYRWNILRENE
jgi:uncharacterized protein YfaT (DUF1175 family)